MKTVKKLASLLLVMVMVFAMATTAFAAEEKGTITVDNPVANQTYTAYKIFDVTYNSAKTNYSYTIETTSEWYSTVKGYAETTDNGLTLTGVAGDNTTFVVSTTDAFSAPAFANALKAAVSGKTGTALTADGTTVKAADLDLGYYFVTSSTGALCNLTTTDPTVTIHDKNDIPFDKVDNKESVDVGEIVTYTITGKVPDYTGFTTYTYLITDTMSEGLTFQKNVKVTVGDTDVTSACTITYDKDGNANKFTVSIPVQSYTIGAEIKVTYTAVVNEKAVAKIENNAATLTYSNDPTDTSKTTTTPEDKETVYSAKVVINKYVKGSDTEKLADAEFVLYKEVKTDGSNTTTKSYYKWNETDKKVEWTTDKAQATVKITNDKGAASFDGLKDGTYYLEEIKAPAGYNLLKGPVPVTVNGANATTADLSSLTVTGNVENSSGAELPETGGMGTTIFYVLGSVLILAAVVLLVTRKRMSSR
ncbi:MAG: SpaH/EbpB family LPXTG-anchored major pilin [Oscillospiraceae bacterium]|nr:SpaH/EbpB family LPXTG-anchored major pilin [Oscillospiraceae bacterium]